MCCCHAQKRRIFPRRRQRLSRLPRRPHPSRMQRQLLLARRVITSIVGASKHRRCAQSGLRRVSRGLEASGNSARFRIAHPKFRRRHPNSRPSRRFTRSRHDQIESRHPHEADPPRPNGPNVQLECNNCHRTTAADADFMYADTNYRAATVSYKDTDEFLSVHSETLRTSRSSPAGVDGASEVCKCLRRVHLLTLTSVLIRVLRTTSRKSYMHFW